MHVAVGVSTSYDDDDGRPCVLLRQNRDRETRELVSRPTRVRAPSTFEIARHDNAADLEVLRDAQLNSLSESS